MAEMCGTNYQAPILLTNDVHDHSRSLSDYQTQHVSKLENFSSPMQCKYVAPRLPLADAYHIYTLTYGKYKNCLYPLNLIQCNRKNHRFYETYYIIQLILLHVFANLFLLFSFAQEYMHRTRLLH